MSSTTQSVDELIQQSPDRNNQAQFQEMWQILCEVRGKIDAHFALTLDASVKDLADYGTADGSTKGHLTAWSGDEVDWLIHSYMGTPARSFSNMHLTVWLGPQIDVPHFGMALGTIPDMFVYLDLIPRVDLTTDLDYLDRYYEPSNATFLEFEANPAFSPFVSRCLYMRQAQSRTSLCYKAAPSAANIDLVRKAAHAKVDEWLQLVAAAKPVPVEQQAALAQRDLLVRRTISERDPANIMGEKIFGKDLTDRLVGTLWGHNRASKRPGAWQQ
jgi:hypothetical protein